MNNTLVPFHQLFDDMSICQECGVCSSVHTWMVIVLVFCDDWNEKGKRKIIPASYTLVTERYNVSAQEEKR